MKKTKRTLLYLSLWLSATTISVAQQTAVPRIEQMQNKPTTYGMLDWKQTAKNYDNFVFDTGKTGTHLPLTFISKSDGINYPEVKGIRMFTFVGQNSSDPGEAINIIPAIVGASLVGVDKTNQNGINWVTKAKDFFNKKNGQNVYLNNYSAGTGGDWWYELMPSIYFYQLFSLYPSADSDFEKQLITVADVQLDVLHKLGGKLSPWTLPNLDYRAFNLLTGQPNSKTPTEPEAAGAIAWILHQAYLHTSDARYKEGVDLALSFLQSYTSNPSYELQLPYGIVTAARMNAEMGTGYDINKLLNWAFSSGIGTKRGWGAIVGEWNGFDMSGLIGEANDKGNDYAFVMNGFQHAAALAPVAKYDKRYARALGKWILNLASSSRYFYPGQMPAENQEGTSLQWAKQNNPDSSIPYEAIKQTWSGKSPLAMGDAFRNNWAATDLSLYSGSSVGYLAALINTTNVAGILQLDLNKTDFRGENKYPTYLYYNPNTTQESVTLNLPTGNYEVYDAISETVLKSNASGSVNLNIATDNVLLIVLYPSGSVTELEGNLLKVKNGGVIDFHKNYSYNSSFRVKAFSADKNQTNENQPVIFNCLTENQNGNVNYKWFVNNTEVSGATSSSYTWTPTTGGIYQVKATVSDNANEVSTHELKTIVIGGDFVVPVINDITFNNESPYDLGSTVIATATTNAPNATVKWECSGGSLQNANGLTPSWTLPTTEGNYTLTLTITNALGEVSMEKKVIVKDANAEDDFYPIVYYSFNGNTNNSASKAFHATNVGATLTNDAKDSPNSAYKIDGSTQYIFTPNTPELNFQDQMTLSFWMKPEALGTEQYVISHGSWNDRFKLSLTPQSKLVMTLNTSGGIIDMADETPLVNGKFYHYTIVYDGTKLSIYRNGELVNSRNHTGKIGRTSKDLAIGRMFIEQPNYSFKGILDELRLYDVALDAKSVSKLKDEWDIPTPKVVSIKKLTINGEEWDITKNYALPCGSNSKSIPVTIELFDGAVLDVDANTSVTVGEKEGLYTFDFTISTVDGLQAKSYKLVVEKTIEFNNLVSQKWNNVLTVNNNSQINGGYNFVSYKWYKDGVVVGNMQYYSAGKKATDYLDPNAEYMVELVTDKGEVMHTCASRPVLTQTASFLVYPNPVKTGGLVTVETSSNLKSTQSGKLSVYSVSGALVHQQEVNGSVTTFSLNKSGVYVLKLELNGEKQKSATIIVNE